MLSGHDALFDLIFRRALKVVCILIINSSGSSPSTANTSLFTFKRGKCSLTDTKNSFMLLASISQFPCLLTLAFLNRSLLCPLVFSCFSTSRGTLCRSRLFRASDKSHI